MPREPREDIDSLRAIVSHLNAVLVEASAVVQAVDQFLADEFDIGMWAISRPFDTQRALGTDGREMLITSHLAYGKVAGKCRLHVVAATLDKSDGKEHHTQIVGEDRTPWMLCPRDVKLHSFAMLPELLANLAAKAGEIAQQTTQTVGTVRELLQAMGRPADVPSVQEEAVPALEDSGFSSNASLFRRSRPKSSSLATL